MKKIVNRTTLFKAAADTNTANINPQQWWCQWCPWEWWWVHQGQQIIVQNWKFCSVQGRMSAQVTHTSKARTFIKRIIKVNTTFKVYFSDIVRVKNLNTKCNLKSILLHIIFSMVVQIIIILVLGISCILNKEDSKKNLEYNTL